MPGPCELRGEQDISTAEAEGIDEIEVIEEVDHGITIEVGGREAEGEGIDKVKVIKEVDYGIAVEVGGAVKTDDGVDVGNRDNLREPLSELLTDSVEWHRIQVRDLPCGRLRDRPFDTPGAKRQV